MNSLLPASAEIDQLKPEEIVLAGHWNAFGIGSIQSCLDAIFVVSIKPTIIDGSRIEALDTAGAWVLQKLMHRLNGRDVAVHVVGLRPEFDKLLAIIGEQVNEQTDTSDKVAIARFSLLPVGPPLIWGGAAIWLFYQGAVGWGIFMLLWGFFLISSVDNILKPLLISRSSKLPFVLVLFGVMGGVLAFGFVGIFIGPTLLAVGFSLTREWFVRDGLIKK